MATIIEAPVKKTPRELLRTQLTDNLTQKSQELPSGPLEGEKVVLMSDITWALNEPFPPVSDHGAEVSTPARVVVWANCPRCGQSGALSVEITPELRVDTSGGELHLKAKSKPVSHTCGQMRLAEGNGQGSFDLEDIIGEDKALALGDVVKVGDGEGDGEGYLVGVIVAFDDDGWINVVDPLDSDHIVLAEPSIPMRDDTTWDRCDYAFCPLALEHKGEHLPLKPSEGETADDSTDEGEG